MKYKKTQKAPIPMIVQQMKRRGGKVQGSLNLRLRVRPSPNQAKRRRRNQINGTRVFRKKRRRIYVDSWKQSCVTSTKLPRSARGNFIPILKITGDELPIEQGVGCLLCPLYPLLLGIKVCQNAVFSKIDITMATINKKLLKTLKSTAALRQVVRKQVSFQDRNRENTPNFPCIEI